MLENVPVWVKAIFTVFLGGFATAALTALGEVVAGVPVDYKRALSAGFAGGIVAVLAYLKPAPAQVVAAAKKGAFYGLVGIMFLATPFTLVGCGKSTTLAKAGIILTQGAAAYKAELASLHVAGVLTIEKYNRLNTQADQIIITTGQLAEFLNGLTEVNGNNAAQVLTKVATAVSLLSGVLQNANLGGVPANSKAIQVLNVGILTLHNIAVAVEMFKTPEPGSFSTASAETKEPRKPTSTANVNVELPKISKELADKYFSGK